MPLHFKTMVEPYEGVHDVITPAPDKLGHRKRGVEGWAPTHWGTVPTELLGRDSSINRYTLQTQAAAD